MREKHLQQIKRIKIPLIRATEMAREFPHCEVLGVDLAPVPLLPENLPENCRFEMDDVLVFPILVTIPSG